MRRSNLKYLYKDCHALLKTDVAKLAMTFYVRQGIIANLIVTIVVYLYYNIVMTNIAEKNQNSLPQNLLSELLSDKLDIVQMKTKLEEINHIKQQYENEGFVIERLLDYHKMLNSGFSKDEVINFIKEDDKILQEVDEFMQKYYSLKDYMFGYPANLVPNSAMVKYFKNKETQLTIMNNCADTYQQGNYQMDSKEFERKILDKLFVHFGLSTPIKQKDGTYSGSWGYITSGGSESNRWGIENGLKKLNGGRVYYSDAAHYSVEKAVRMGFHYRGKTIEIPYTKIPTQNNSEKIDTEILLDKIYKNWKDDKIPAIIVLTWGTTKTGAIDDVEEITNKLKDIPHYIHLDAALFGGIAQNQVNAPQIPDMKKLDIDSISVSFHKYIGNSEVRSAVLAKEKPIAQTVDYIGQVDSTTAGSRNINPFSMLQQVTEALYRKNNYDYYKNIEVFENLLISNNIDYTREALANIFVINKPKDNICKKYQLSVFNDNGIEKAHIIIFPYHKEGVMQELAQDLKS